MKHFLLTAILLGGFLAFDGVANANHKGCVFKIEIKNSTGKKLTIRKLSYRHSTWERLLGKKLVLKANKTTTKSKMNIVLKCSDFHDWGFLYKCDSYTSGGKKVTFSQYKRTKKGIKGNSAGQVALTKVEIKNCEGQVSWTKPTF